MSAIDILSKHVIEQGLVSHSKRLFTLSIPGNKFQNSGKSLCSSTQQGSPSGTATVLPQLLPWQNLTTFSLRPSFYCIVMFACPEAQGATCKCYLWVETDRYLGDAKNHNCEACFQNRSQLVFKKFQVTKRAVSILHLNYYGYRRVCTSVKQEMEPDIHSSSN